MVRYGRVRMQLVCFSSFDLTDWFCWHHQALHKLFLDGHSESAITSCGGLMNKKLKNYNFALLDENYYVRHGQLQKNLRKRILLNLPKPNSPPMEISKITPNTKKNQVLFVVVFLWRINLIFFSSITQNQTRTTSKKPSRPLILLWIYRLAKMDMRGLSVFISDIRKCKHVMWAVDDVSIMMCVSLFDNNSSPPPSNHTLSFWQFLSDTTNESVSFSSI